MQKRTVLVTGGSGFIGSNFIKHFFNKNDHDTIINIDKLTYAASLDNNASYSGNSNYIFKQIDICDKSAVLNIFNEYVITDIIHFAAESHVDNSITSPSEFINTNIVGTFNLLECARNTWLDSPFIYKENFKNSRFHHISTDEVYGTLGETGLFTEETAYAPNSPYSASKASSDLIVRSYYHTYGLNIVTTNCSNNYGPHQHDEKLIPTIIRNALNQNDIPIYGDGKNIRDWLYVDDHCDAILRVFEEGNKGETYNIGGNCELTNIQLCNYICNKLDEVKPVNDFKYSSLIKYVKDRPGHDKRYAIDITKISNNLSWSPSYNIELGIQKTIEWYINKYSK